MASHEDIKFDQAAYMRQWTAAKRAAGICVACGTAPAVTGKRKCQACSDKFNAARRERRAALRGQKLCTECGKPAWKNHSRCETCFKLNKRVVDERRAAALAQGLCYRCCRKPLASNYHCEDCHLGMVAHSIWRDRFRAPELRALFNKQQGLCTYTGVRLKIGANASIDHIIPSSRGGNDDISNLHWVDLRVNKMKLDNTEAEFFDLILAVVRYCQLVP